MIDVSGHQILWPWLSLEIWVVCAAFNELFNTSQPRCNRGMFGWTVDHVVQSDSVWNSLGLCSSSISNSCSSSSNSCSSNSCSSNSNSCSCSSNSCSCSTTSKRRPALSIQQQQDRAGLIRPTAEFFSWIYCSLYCRKYYNNQSFTFIH